MQCFQLDPAPTRALAGILSESPATIRAVSTVSYKGEVFSASYITL